MTDCDLSDSPFWEAGKGERKVRFTSAGRGRIAVQGYWEPGVLSQVEIDTEKLLSLIGWLLRRVGKRLVLGVEE